MAGGSRVIFWQFFLVVLLRRAARLQLEEVELREAMGGSADTCN